MNSVKVKPLHPYEELDNRKERVNLMLLFTISRRSVILTIIPIDVSRSSGGLEDYLAEINEYTKKRLWDYIQEIAKAQGVTEELKAHDQILWLGKMNNICNIAEEMVFDELIYY